MYCRHCQTKLQHLFVDLGQAPPSNAYRQLNEAKLAEKIFPLKVYVCHQCWLVQTQDYINADELFCHDYAYFSSTSKSWLKHAENYAEMIIERLGLNRQSQVIEIASNDGYLLKNFVKRQIPCLGIEPTLDTAKAAQSLGIPVECEFFTEQYAQQLLTRKGLADLIIANNVLAHVPDINDFIRGIKNVLAEKGTVTFEFPHLLALVRDNQFDTIYHEHFSYLSLTALIPIFQRSGLAIYDVEQLTTHGGSLRIYVSHTDSFSTLNTVNELQKVEQNAGMQNLSFYQNFQQSIDGITKELKNFLTTAKAQGKCVVGYGAAAKGNTLLNYAEITSELLPVIFDAAPSKQNKLMPGSGIKIISPNDMLNYQIDYILILPWNIKAEVIAQFSHLSNVTFVTAIPKLSMCTAK